MFVMRFGFLNDIKLENFNLLTISFLGALRYVKFKLRYELLFCISVWKDTRHRPLSYERFPPDWSTKALSFNSNEN